MKYDVVVVGAGAAGLAAARELSGAGKRVCLMEARPRVGGRIHTLHLPDLPLPVELGAEFVHGEAHQTFSIIEAAALMACELPDNHWWVREGRWELIRDFWGQIDTVRTLLTRLRRDVSFDEFLRSRRSLPPRLRELARTFVEGYHASHADRISARSLALSDQEQEEAAGNKQFRILNGYDALMAWLRAGLDPARVEVRLGTAVADLRWRKGEVVINSSVRAAAAVLTIPIGVWKAAGEQVGAIRFQPALREKTKALEKLEVGHVVKVAFRFTERFWDELPPSPGARAVNFLHSSDRFVPTWWTSAPVRTPILTGWAGGHAADALLAEGEDGLIDRALDSLASTMRIRRRWLDSRLAASFTHNWQADPFSRGAYSYASPGGIAAHKALARPVQATLFFAGEATHSQQTGTVAGAIESGVRAAREVLKSSA